MIEPRHTPHPVAPVLPVQPYAEPEALPLVTPLHILAARRQSFDCIVRRLWSEQKALDAIFEALPLVEYGWHRATTKAFHIGNAEGRFPIWRVSRGI